MQIFMQINLQAIVGLCLKNYTDPEETDPIFISIVYLYTFGENFFENKNSTFIYTSI